MPKRPNPSSETNGEDGAKKARAGSSDSSTNCNGGDACADAGAKQPVGGTADAAQATVAAASMVASAALPTPTAGVAAAASAATSTKATSLASTATKSNGSSGGGNAFLKSLRSSKTTVNGDDAKNPVPGDAAAAPTAQTKKETVIDPITNSVAPPASATPPVPVAPSPYLPLDSDSRLSIIAMPAIVVLLFLLNMAAATYTASQQSRQNLMELKSNLELNKLQEDLDTSQDDVRTLRERMKSLERAREVRERMLADDTRVSTGLFGTMVGGGNDNLLTGDERDDWLGKLRTLEAHERAAENEFIGNLVQFEVESTR